MATATSTRSLQCVIVTPERAVVDEQADFVALPLYDGEIGILPGRAPLVGRLGYGELRIKRGGQTKRFFVDGGFVQVRANVVTVLTPRAIPAAELKVDAARQALDAARATHPRNPVEQAGKEKAQARARAQLRILGATPASAHEAHG